MTGSNPHQDGPYYAVIFTGKRTEIEDKEYGAMAEAMETLAKQQPGYLGIESVRGEDGVGITVSYWKDETSIRAWKAVIKHRAAQDKGKRDWYQWYHVRVAKVERAYSFSKKE